MKKDFIYKIKNAPRSGEPRLIANVLTEMLAGYSPLADGYRNWLLQQETRTESRKEAENGRD